MAQKKHTPEQIIRKREVEVAGQNAPQAVKQIGVSEDLLPLAQGIGGMPRRSGSKSWRRRTSG